MRRREYDEVPERQYEEENWVLHIQEIFMNSAFLQIKEVVTLEDSQGNDFYSTSNLKREKDKKVIPDPIDDRKVQEWKESGKSGILLGITLNPRKCIGEKVRRIPIRFPGRIHCPAVNKGTDVLEGRNVGNMVWLSRRQVTTRPMNQECLNDIAAGPFSKSYS